MTAFQDQMQEYTQQLQKGSIQQAYKGLLQFMLGLRNELGSAHPEIAVPGSFYAGYMDMSYFSLVPAALKERGLKIAVVYLHEASRFEVWLSAANKKIQARYWELIVRSGWRKYRLVPSTQGYDSILEDVLAESPDFSDLPALSAQITQGTLAFIADVEAYLAENAAS